MRETRNLILNLSEPHEIFGFESGPGAGGFFGELIYLVAQGWPIVAPRTRPVVAFEETLAREAPFHPSLKNGAQRQRNNPQLLCMSFAKASLLPLVNRWWNLRNTTLDLYNYGLSHL